MAVQKRRKSKAKRSMRRSAWMASVKVPHAVACPRCHAPKESHRVCKECGYYDGREVLAREEAE